MGTAFKLNGGLLFLSTEAPGGVYNASQLKKIAQIAEQDSIVIKATEDQRLGLFVPLSKVPKIATDLKSVGLGMRHYQDGLHQPVNCAGEFCPEKMQDAMATSIQLTKELAQGGALGSKLKIGINGCGTCCVPSHTLDISIIGEPSGYRLSLGGKNSQIPEMASFMAEGVPAEKIVGLVVKIVEYYKKVAQKGESLQEVMERTGTSSFIKILAPYSQDAHQSGLDQEAQQDEHSSLDGPALENAEDISFAEPEIGDIESEMHEAGPAVEIGQEDHVFNDPSLEAIDAADHHEDPSLDTSGATKEIESADEALTMDELPEEIPLLSEEDKAAIEESQLGEDLLVPEDGVDESGTEDLTLQGHKAGGKPLELIEESFDENIEIEEKPGAESLDDQLRGCENLAGDDVAPIDEEHMIDPMVDENTPNLAESSAYSQGEVLEEIPLEASEEIPLEASEEIPLEASEEIPLEASEEIPLEVMDTGEELANGQVSAENIVEQGDQDTSTLMSEDLETEDLGVEGFALEDDGVTGPVSKSGQELAMQKTEGDEFSEAAFDSMPPPVSTSGPDLQDASEMQNVGEASENEAIPLKDPASDDTQKLDKFAQNQMQNSDEIPQDDNEDLGSKVEEVSESEAEEFEQKLVASIEEEKGLPELEDSNQEERQAAMRLVEVSQPYPTEDALQESLEVPKDFSDLGIDQEPEVFTEDEVFEQKSPTTLAKASGKTGGGLTPTQKEGNKSQSSTANQEEQNSLELEGLDLDEGGRVVLLFNAGSKFVFDYRQLRIGKEQKLKFRRKQITVFRDDAGVSVEVDGMTMTVPTAEVA